jgi:hypothetical protein
MGEHHNYCGLHLFKDIPWGIPDSKRGVFYVGPCIQALLPTISNC